MNSRLLLLVAAAALAACGGGGGSSASPPAPRGSFTLQNVAEVAVSQCHSVTGQTVDWCNTNWPAASDGTVYLYTVNEAHKATGGVLARTAYVYKPARIGAGSYPLLMFLHGGTQSGAALFDHFPFAQLADGRVSAASPKVWYKNTADCQQDALGGSGLGYGGSSVTGFITATGAGCVPPQVSYSPTATSPFYLVFPNGFPEVSAVSRAWEDGRNPSPGFENTAQASQQNRDDVGYINFLFATVKSREGGLVDPTRVYFGGSSGGGTMATRVMCNLDNSNYPELKNIAAVSVSIASMPDNLYFGSNGRELCPGAGHTPTPLSIFVGYDAPTPNAPNDGTPFNLDCGFYNEKNPGDCSYPIVSGDGTMPYGTAYRVGGGTFTVNSPSKGKVIATEDHQNFWLNYFVNSGAGASTQTLGDFGYFTHYRRYTFATSPMVFQLYETKNGLHLTLGERGDFEPIARIYDFLFSFRKTDGKVTYIGGSYNAQTGGYGNLAGKY
jgi:poly(3-hydroxybutyrate) depolymerase